MNNQIPPTPSVNPALISRLLVEIGFLGEWAIHNFLMNGIALPNGRVKMPTKG